jgi:hypothetical protein
MARAKRRALRTPPCPAPPPARSLPPDPFPDRAPEYRTQWKGFHCVRMHWIRWFRLARRTQT